MSRSAESAFSVAQAVSRPELATPIALLQQRRSEAPDHVAFHVRDAQGQPVDYSLTEFCAMVDRIAAALARDGVQPGDAVAVMGPTSFGWALAEWGIWRAGASSSPSTTLLPLRRWPPF